MKKVILARLQHGKKSESFVDQSPRMRFGRQPLGGFQNLALKNLIVNSGPVRAVPAPELAVLFITKVRAAIEMMVQHRLCQLLARIG